MPKKPSTITSWLSRKMVQSNEQAELNNLCAAILMVEAGPERQELLTRFKQFFDQYPETLQLSSENWTFYNDFLTPTKLEALPADPLRWRAMAEMSRYLKA